MANEQNLRPAEYKLSVEEAKKGGIASGKTRREKASFKQAIKWLAENGDLKIAEGDLYELYKKNGIDISNLNPTQLATIGLWFGATTGKAENYRVLMQGNEEILESTETPEVNINIIDNSNLEKVLYEEDKEE